MKKSEKQEKSENVKKSENSENKEFDFAKIEKKWQDKWEKAQTFKVEENSKKKKYYVLEMYPYPSASFLHMGHVRNYTIGDTYARFKRMNGFNVLYPMGYDSFGLPAETASKKEGIHPKKYAEASIKKISEYFKALGTSYDWSRTLASHEPEYYKWNQYFFLKLFEKGLAYRKKAPINWCENCASVLANEEAEGGECWRCGKEVVKKDLEQWFFKITDYADRLLEDLEKIDWPDKIKIMQRNWIGKSHGTEILFEINKEKWPVFTTRPDTIFGVTFMVISSQHPRLLEITTKEQKKEIEKLMEKSKKAKTSEEMEKLEKVGVFTGSYAIHPITGEKIPVWAGNFVLADYGSGMVMAVPAHDARDFDFAKKYNLPIKFVIEGKTKNKESECYLEKGKLINSKEFNGIDNEQAKQEITEFLNKKKLGKKVVNYKIRDWLISRQRYWGTPIPMIYCDKCGIVPVPEKDLPVLLPEKVEFKSSNPLTTCKEFVEVKCPKCKSKARRETDTMGGFVDSSWYFLRYCDNKNKDKPFDKKKVDYWMPVDQYIGGAEHAVMHLLYARFFVKVLKDLGYVNFDEPFSKLFNQGIVYKDGAKMSKSKGNVVYQTEISEKYGIDTARLFLMFVSSPDKQMEWSDSGVEGSYRIINRIIRLSQKIKKCKQDVKTESKFNLNLKRIIEFIESFDYPKAIISATNYLEHLESLEEVPKESYENILKIFSPFCPHVTEELWEKIGNKSFLSLEQWPAVDESKINENFEKQEQAIEKIVSDINQVVKIVLDKGTSASKVYLYVMPNEKDWISKEAEFFKEKTGLDVKIFAVNDKDKYDPEEKSKKAKPGKPGIYLE